MSFCGKWIPCALAAVMLIAVNGCSPADSSSEDEEKEPHFVLGNSRFNGMEYDGAIEAFQQSLEVNPHSAQAHYRLAQLFDTKRPNPASAIYHYQEYLRLNPQADNAEVIRQRILTCKQQLASDVMSMPTAPREIRQIEQLTETNRLLQAQVDSLNQSVKQWSAYAGSLEAAAKNSPTPNNSAPPSGSPTPDDVSSVSTGSTVPLPGARRVVRPTAPRVRTHLVAAGETLASIARKQGVSLAELQAANPGVSPKKLRAGQTVVLP